MSTNSTITLIEKQADWIFYHHIYCHWDGYLGWAGSILATAYTDTARLKRLFNRGSLSVLGLYPQASPLTQQIGFEVGQKLMEIQSWHWQRDQGAENFHTFDEVCEYLEVNLPANLRPAYQQAWEAYGYNGIHDLEQLFTIAYADRGDHEPSMTGQLGDSDSVMTMLKQVLAVSSYGKMEYNYVYLTGFDDETLNHKWFVLHSTYGKPDEFSRLVPALRDFSGVGPKMIDLAREYHLPVPKTAVKPSTTPQS